MPKIFTLISGHACKFGLVGENILPVEIYDQIGETILRASFVSRDDIMLDLHKMKSEADIKLRARAAATNDEEQQRAVKDVKVGVTEIQVTAVAKKIARHFNADIGSSTVVMSGPNIKCQA